jgi:hypothetical protein
MKKRSILSPRGLAIVVVVLIALSVTAGAQSDRLSSDRPRHFTSGPGSRSNDKDDAPGTWQPLANQPPITEIYDTQGNDYGPGGAAGPLLMTDGSVLVQDAGWYGEDARIFKLTPDIWGSYVNGTWSEYTDANGWANSASRRSRT